MIENNNDKEFNEYFWTFIYLIISDNTFLSDKGKVMKQIVQSNKYNRYIARIAKASKISAPKVSIICRDFKQKGYIVIEQKSKYKIIKFNEETITEALRIPHKILGEQL